MSHEESRKKMKIDNLLNWKDAITSMFGNVNLDCIELKDNSDIVNYLDYIGKYKVDNHTLLPSGGGLDLTGSRFSNEEGKIELEFGSSIDIVNPRSLKLNKLNNNPEWWYFRLETDEFSKTDVYKNSDNIDSDKDLNDNSDLGSKKMNFIGEDVLEIYPGEYVDYGFYVENHLGYDENGNEIPLPEKSRAVSRMVNGGSYVIFPKFSIYAQFQESYNAIHNNLSGDEFREQLSKVINKYEK